MSDTYIPRPTTDDRVEWRAYWQDQGQPWRMEPEIDAARQAFLSERRAIRRNVAKNIYPFEGVSLTRADVEWLLATHESGRGPVDWDDPTQRRRRGIDLHGAVLTGVNLRYLPLANATLGLTREEWWHSESIVRPEDHATRLEGADLQLAHLEGASIRFAPLQNANLLFANLRAAELRSATLAGANLERTTLDGATALVNITLSDDAHGCAKLADVGWGGTNMALLDWTQVADIGEESTARKMEPDARRAKGASARSQQRREVIASYQAAVRGYRQLAAQLRSQGLSELSDRFSYRALKVQRNVLRLQRRHGELLGSRFLDALAGYGFRPIRSFIAYALFVLSFAGLYTIVSAHQPFKLSPLEALVFSITSFHGRGFSPSASITLSNPLTMLAAVEAMIGLIIEITFIATFTQRYFGSE